MSSMNTNLYRSTMRGLRRTIAARPSFVEELRFLVSDAASPPVGKIGPWESAVALAASVKLVRRKWREPLGEAELPDRLEKAFWIVKALSAADDPKRSQYPAAEKGSTIPAVSHTPMPFVEEFVSRRIASDTGTRELVKTGPERYIVSNEHCELAVNVDDAVDRLAVRFDVQLPPDATLEGLLLYALSVREKKLLRLCFPPDAFVPFSGEGSSTAAQTCRVGEEVAGSKAIHDSPSGNKTTKSTWACIREAFPVMMKGAVFYRRAEADASEALSWDSVLLTVKATDSPTN